MIPSLLVYFFFGANLTSTKNMMPVFCESEHFFSQQNESVVAHQLFHKSPNLLKRLRQAKKEC